MLRAQALVIGGGPAGSSAARFLAQGGIDTLLIERNPSFIKPCGGGIPSTSFHELGIPEYPIRRRVDTIKVVSPKGDTLHIKLTGGFIAIVERGDFDSVLRAEAEKAGAMVLNAEFRSFIDVGETVTAELMAGGKTINVQADYVIAADGINSRVRAALNIRPVPSFLTISGRIKEDTDFCEFWFGSSHAPGFYSWVFPQKEGISVGTGSLDHYRIKALYQRFLEKRGLGAGGHPQKSETFWGPRCGSLRGYRIPIWQGDIYNLGRVLFAGDAAGQVMPLSYEGIYYAMKSGELAAMAIINKRIGDYRRLWEKRFHARFSLMKRLWAFFLKDDSRAERLVQLHKRPEVQEVSMKLWLRKDLGKGSLLSYINIFRGYIFQTKDSLNGG